MYSQHVCSDHESPVASVDADIKRLNRELESIVDQIISDVYSKNVDPLNLNYIRKIGNLMTSAIYDSFDSTSPDFDSKDIKFLEGLRKNAYYFVGGKSKALTKSFQDLLLDGDNVRSFSKFKQEAQKIGLQFNVDHLKTEYEMAISSSQSISDWSSFESSDMLQFSAVMDGRTRPHHARLDGLTLPKNDSLWNSITPPLGWHCRCRLIVVSGKASKPTAKQRSEYKKIADKDFRFNPGKTGDLFPKNHPYIKSLSKADKAKIDGLVP